MKKVEVKFKVLGKREIKAKFEENGSKGAVF